MGYGKAMTHETVWVDRNWVTAVAHSHLHPHTFVETRPPSEQFPTAGALHIVHKRLKKGF